MSMAGEIMKLHLYSEILCSHLKKRMFSIYWYRKICKIVNVKKGQFVKYAFCVKREKIIIWIGLFIHKETPDGLVNKRLVSNFGEIDRVGTSR